MLKTINRSLLIFVAFFVAASCDDDSEDTVGINRDALIGTWTGNDYECLFDKPRDVKLVITKGKDPLGLKINLNDGEYIIDADYGEDHEKKAFVGERKTSTYSIMISGLLYDDGVLRLTVFIDDDVCDAMLTKQ